MLKLPLTLLMKMEKTECSGTWGHKIQTPRNHPKENYQHFNGLHLQSPGSPRRLSTCTKLTLQTEATNSSKMLQKLFTNGHGVISNKTLPVIIQQLVEDYLPFG